LFRAIIIFTTILSRCSSRKITISSSWTSRGSPRTSTRWRTRTTSSSSWWAYRWTRT